MLVVFFLQGSALGLLDVVGNTLIVWANTEDWLNPWMNTLHFSFGIGALTSPALLAAIPSENWGGVYLIVAASTLVSGGLTVLEFPPTQPEADECGCCPSEGTSRIPCVLILGGLTFFLYSGVEVGFGSWIFTYAFDKGIADREEVRERISVPIQ